MSLKSIKMLNISCHLLECKGFFLVHAVPVPSATTFRHQVQALCYWQEHQLAERHPAETPSHHYHCCSRSGTPGHREGVWKIKMWKKM